MVIESSDTLVIATSSADTLSERRRDGFGVRGACPCGVCLENYISASSRGGRAAGADASARSR